MTSAVGRIQTQAGSLSGQVQGLKQDSAALVGELKRVDAQARAAAETLAKYRSTVAAGGTLTEKQLSDVSGLKEFIVARGGAPGQAFVSQFERELGGGAPQRTGADRAAAMAAPPRGPVLPRPAVVAPMPDSGPRGLSAAEQAAYLARGGYTAEQLARARLLKPGTLYIPPEQQRKSRSSPPTDGQGPELPEQSVAPPSSAPAPPGSSPRPASSTRDSATAENVEALQRRDAAQRAFGLTERALRAEWTTTTRQLREQSRELDKTEASYVRLKRIEDDRGRLSSTQQRQLEELPTKITDLRQGFRALRVDRDVLAQEAGRRGYEVYGDRLFGPERSRAGALRSFMGGLGGGLGGGGGSLLGGAGGLLAGTMTPAGLAASLGLALGAFAVHSGDVHEQTQRGVFATGMRLGGGFGNLRRTATAGLHGPLKLQFAETLAAVQALAMQTGQTDASGVTALARAYGLPVEATAQLVGQMGAAGIMPRATVTQRRIQIPGTPDRMVQLPTPMQTLAAPFYAGATAVNTLTAPGMPIRSMFRTALNLLADPFNTGKQLVQDGAISKGLAGAVKLIADPANTSGAMARRMMSIPGRPAVDRVVETRTGRGLPEILASGYRSTGYTNNALMSAYLQQVGNLIKTQGAGGAPIRDFDRMPSMLSAGIRMFGPDVAPQFGAELAGGVVRGITTPPGAVQRGVALRAIMQMGRETGRKFTLDGVGEVDPRSYTGATALMQNAFSLPDGQRQAVLRAVAGAYRGLVGKGTDASGQFFTKMFGGKAAMGLMADKGFEDLIDAKPGADGGGGLVDMFKKLTGDAGSEATPFMNDARIAELETKVGEPLKRLSQALTTAVMDFSDEIRNTQAAWETGTPQTPATQQSGGTF